MPLSISKEHNEKWEDWFYYDETSPTCLRWKVARGTKIKAGDVAGSHKQSGEHFGVTLDGRKYKVHRIIWELHCGLIPPGFVVDHRDGDRQFNVFGNFRLITQAKNNRNTKKRDDNKSGIVGVTRISNGKGNYYWTAKWCDLDGRIVSKHFSVRLGDAEAFRLACEHRAKMIEELNKQGAGYTEDHGIRV